MDENVLEQWAAEGTNVNSLEARTHGARVGSLVHVIREERLKHAKRTTQLVNDCEKLLDENARYMEDGSQFENRMAAKDSVIEANEDVISDVRTELVLCQNLRAAEAGKMQALLDAANEEVSRQTEICLDLKAQISELSVVIHDLKAQLAETTEGKDAALQALADIQAEHKPKKPKGS